MVEVLLIFIVSSLRECCILNQKLTLLATELNITLSILIITTCRSKVKIVSKLIFILVSFCKYIILFLPTYLKGEDKSCSRFIKYLIAF